MKSPIESFTENFDHLEPQDRHAITAPSAYYAADTLWLEAVKPLTEALLATSKYFSTHSTDLEGSRTLVQVEEALATLGLGALAPFTE